jgi:hypothetical protein
MVPQLFGMLIFTYDAANPDELASRYGQLHGQSLMDAFETICWGADGENTAVRDRA